MDLFTIDNVGETELLNQNTNDNNSVQFVRKIDALDNDTEDVEEATDGVEEEEDEDLSEADFGGK